MMLFVHVASGERNELLEGLSSGSGSVVGEIFACIINPLLKKCSCFMEKSIPCSGNLSTLVFIGLPTSMK